MILFSDSQNNYFIGFNCAEHQRTMHGVFTQIDLRCYSFVRRVSTFALWSSLLVFFLTVFHLALLCMPIQLKAFNYVDVLVSSCTAALLSLIIIYMLPAFLARAKGRQLYGRSLICDARVSVRVQAFLLLSALTIQTAGGARFILDPGTHSIIPDLAMFTLTLFFMYRLLFVLRLVSRPPVT
jgi:hypothetical protein